MFLDNAPCHPPMLWYVASQIDVNQCTSDVIKSVNLLMAVRWMVSAWE